MAKCLECFLELSCQTVFFRDGKGVDIILVEISKGWEVIFVLKNWKFREGGVLA